MCLRLFYFFRNFTVLETSRDMNNLLSVREFEMKSKEKCQAWNKYVNIQYWFLKVKNIWHVTLVIFKLGGNKGLVKLFDVWKHCKFS